MAHISDCYPPRIGGIESQVHDLAHAQAAAGDDVVVLTATKGPDGGGGVTVHRLVTPLVGSVPVNPLAGRRMRALLAQLAPDVVHVHAGVVSQFAFEGIRVASDLGLPVLVTWHCMIDGYLGGLRAWARRVGIGRRPIALSAVSGPAARRVQNALGVSGVALLPNGLQVDQWRAAGQPPMPSGPLEVVSTMRLAARKRPLALARVMRMVREQLAAAPARHPVPEIRLSVIGDGPKAAALRRAAVRHRLDIRLLGTLGRAEIRAEYAHSQVFLSPVRLEAFGIAALEARAAGLAMVGYRASGISEFVRDGVDGLLVDSDRGLAHAVAQLALQPDRLAEILRHNARTAPAYAWSDCLARANEQYRRAIDLASGRHAA